MGEHSPGQNIEYAGAAILVVGGVVLEIATQQIEVEVITWLGALGLVMIANNQEER